MDIDKLRDIVKRGDGEGFCQFFRQLKPEDVLKLSEDEYQEIMSFAQQMEMEGFIRDDSFFEFLYYIAHEYLKLAERGWKGEVRQSAFLSLFYNSLFLNLCPIRNEIFASSLMHKGFSLRILAEQGVNTIKNLEESLKCYDEAEPIRKSTQLSYAGLLLNKGVSLSRLAEQGVNTIENLKESINCYDEAASIFMIGRDELYYAGALMNKGFSLLILAKQGVNNIENLNESIKCYNEAAPIFISKKAELYYARNQMNKGVSLRRLAEQGVNPIKNLTEAIKCYNKAATIFKRKKAELSYAGILTNKGNSLLTLAEQGVNKIENLEKSIKCFDDASPILKRKGSELNYGITLMNKGNSLRILAEYRVDVERNFALAMEIYKEAEGIFLQKGSLINFVMASANRIIGLWWRFQETNDDNYLIQARKLCEKALAVALHITHPAKASIIALLIMINDILADKYLALDRVKYDEIIKRLKKIERHTERILPLKEKIDLILSCIEKSTTQIIKNIKRSGEKVSEEVAKGFTILADDLRELIDEHQRKLLEELCRLLTDPSFQKKFLREAPPEKRGSIKSIFQRIGETAKDIAGHMPAALAAHQIFCYFDWLWVEVLHLTPLHPALVLGMIISPFIAFKDRLSKN